MEITDTEQPSRVEIVHVTAVESRADQLKTATSDLRAAR